MLRYDRHGKLKPYKEPWLATVLYMIAVFGGIASIFALFFGLSEDNSLTAYIGLGGLLSAIFIAVISEIYSKIHYLTYLQAYMLFVLIPEGRFFTRDIDAAQKSAEAQQAPSDNNTNA